MNKWLLAMPVLVASVSTQADMILSGVYDGPLTGGLPKGFEIYVTADIADLSLYGAGAANNGGGSDGQEITFAGSATAGSYIYVTTDLAGFVGYFGFTPAQVYVSSAASINGDDAIELFKNGDVIDVFGDINIDGSGQPWDYLDGWAYRLSDDQPNLGIFDVAQWSYSGVNAWDGETSNSTAASPLPLATFTTEFTNIDDPVDPPPTAEIGACFEPATLISAVQGAGTSVAVSGDVIIEGIVTGFNDDGFFVQEESSDSDGDSSTSEGIFVFGNPLATMATGHLVRVLGEAGEFFDNSQISAAQLLDCGVTDEVVTPVDIPMPFDGILELESIEGMLAKVTDATVYSLDNFTRFGEMNLSDGLKWTPSDVAVPQSEAYLAQVDNASANILLIADDNGDRFPETISYYSTPEFDGLNYANAPRIGDFVSAKGPVFFSFGNYRILPTKEHFSIWRKRPALPDVSAGDVTVASFNVLNYFNGQVQADGSVSFDYPENRGAQDATEFALQQARIVAALAAMDADVVSLVEIENDGFGSDSAIAQLVKELNTVLGANVYRFARSANSDVTGTDAISNAIIFKPSVVRRFGPLQGIQLPTQDNNGDIVAMRNALVQRFRHRKTGDTFAVVANHFKSKGSQCFEDENSPTELDAIQGSCNALRVSAAVKLGQRLKRMWLPKKVLITGDLNAYSQEDPIAVLTDYAPEQRGYTIHTAVNTELNNGASVAVTRGFGFVSVKEVFDPSGYSYYFFGTDQVGSLDHILASPQAMKAVVGLSHWNINAAEMFQLQYDQALSFYNGANGDLIDFTAIGPYRSSDHDAVIVSLDMKRQHRFFK